MKMFTRYSTLITFLAVSGLVFAQDPGGTPQQQNTGGWRRVTDPPPANQPMTTQTPQDTSTPAYSQNSPAYPQQDPGYAQQGPQQTPPPPQGPQQYPAGNGPQYGPPPQWNGNGQQYPNANGPQYGPPPQWNGNGQQYPSANGPQYPGANGQQPYAEPPIPPQLTIKQGSYVTVRMNQPLSSDHNQVGDAFTATLAEPLVVDGVVLAQRGQTVTGRVTESQKAGRVEGVSKLGVQLTTLTLSDGQQVPIQSSLVNRRGPTSQGQDAAAIAGTTGLGAAVGAAADWGRGAAIGAGAGAAVGIIGVLLTRGHATVIYPESVLTFRVEAPVTISTEHAPYAFHWVSPGEYEHPYQTTGPPPGAYGPRYAYGPGAPPPYYYGYGVGYPYYWGPGLGFYYGPGFWGRGYYGGGVIIRGGGFHGGGFHGGGHRH